MTTTTLNQAKSIQGALDRANPNELADALRELGLGKMLATVKVVFASLTEEQTLDITTAAAKAAATITGIELKTGENLPAIGNVVSCRVTAGTAAAGDRQITDAGGTATTAVATLSNDGTTLGFEADGVTGLVLVYQPRAAVALTTLLGD